MTLLLVSAFLAGMGVTLLPCILPVLTIMLTGVIGGRLRPYGLVSGFILSFAIVTLSLASLVKLFDIDGGTLRFYAAIVIIILGLIMLIPQFNLRFEIFTSKITSKLSRNNKTATPQNGYWGGFFTGLPLGFIWAPCAGPILAFVISLTVSAQTNLGALLVVLAYSLGVSVVMLIIIFSGRFVMTKIGRFTPLIQQILAGLVIIMGVMMLYGYDKKLEAFLLTKLPASWTSAVQSFEGSETINQELKNL